MNIGLVLTGANFMVSSMAAKGAKIIAKEAFEYFVPDDLTANQELCIKIAEYGAAISFGAACSAGATRTLNMAMKAYDMINELQKEVETRKAEMEVNSDEEDIIDETTEVVDTYEDIEVEDSDLDFLQ